jgi:hypothetical protein
VFSKVVSAIADPTLKVQHHKIIVRLWNDFVAQATATSQSNTTEKQNQIRITEFVKMLIKSLRIKAKSGKSLEKSERVIKYLTSLDTKSMSSASIMTALRKVFAQAKLNQLYEEFIKSITNGKKTEEQKKRIRDRQINHLSTLLHAYSCDRSNCPVKLCVGMRKMWRHWYTCPDTSLCKIKECKNLRQLALHFYDTCYPKITQDPKYKCPKGICDVAFRKGEPEECLKFDKSQIKKGFEEMIIKKCSSSSESSNLSTTSSSSSETTLSSEVMDSLLHGMYEFLNRVSDSAADRAIYRSGDSKSAAIILDDIEHATSQCYPEADSSLEVRRSVRNLKTKRSRYMFSTKNRR